MDDALQRAHRAALANPGDAAAREAYGQALLRAGRRVGAFHELSAARALVDGPEAEPPRLLVERPEQVGQPPVAWRVGCEHLVCGAGVEPADPSAAPRAEPAVLPAPVAPPERTDEQWPGALLHREPGGDLQEPQPLVLVPRRPCTACRGGLVVCEACEGQGFVLEFAGRADARVPCDDCEETGRVPCPACGGSDVAFGSPAPAGPCDHAAARARWEARGVRVAEAVVGRWALVRCDGCGLALAADVEGGDQVHAPCPRCGRLACEGDCAALGA